MESRRSLRLLAGLPAPLTRHAPLPPLATPRPLDRRLLRETYEPELLTSSSHLEAAGPHDAVVEVRSAAWHGMAQQGRHSMT